MDLTLLGVLKLSALVVLWGLMAAAVLPLVALGIYVIADKLKLHWLADPLRGALEGLFRLQWLVGPVVNILAGLALMAMGLWSVLAMLSGASLDLVLVLTPVLIPFGIWRVWIAINVLRQLRSERTRNDGN